MLLIIARYKHDIDLSKVHLFNFYQKISKSLNFSVKFAA